MNEWICESMNHQLLINGPIDRLMKMNSWMSEKWIDKLIKMNDWDEKMD